jgi:glycosyltransferase involved in cell wall biosynthesis
MTRSPFVAGARPLRVLVTCDWFLKYAAAQSAGLADAGAAVVLLCRGHAQEFGGDAREQTRALVDAARAGVTIIEIPGRLSDLRAARSLLAIRSRIARFDPDVVHAHDGADPRALGLTPRVVTVLTLHDPAPHPGQPVPTIPKRWFLHGSRDAWRARATAIVVHSERLRSEVALRPGQQCAVVPHGLYAQSRPLPAPAQRAVAFFGRLTPYKGLEVLARAMPRVWNVRPDVHLRIAGDGESRLELEDPRVRWQRGYLPEAGLEQFFGAASLAVLPYTQASQTGAGSVAIGYGIPIVVSRVGGLPDLALDESYVFAPGDDSGLAAVIFAHIDDDDEVRSRVLRDVATPLSWDALGVQSLKLYQELLDRR